MNELCKPLNIEVVLRCFDVDEVDSVMFFVTGTFAQVCAWASLLLLGSRVRVSRASLTRMDTALRMKEANRFMWMLFLMQ